MKLGLSEREVIFEAQPFHWQVDMIGLNMLTNFGERLHREPEVGDRVEDVDGHVACLFNQRRSCALATLLFCHQL